MPTAEEFLTDEAAPDSAETFLNDAPTASAEDFLAEKPGEIAGTVNEFERGLLAGQQQIVAAQRAAAPKGPTMRQARRAYVNAMSDPRYMQAVVAAGDDPVKLQRVEDMLGPTGRLNTVRERYRAERNILDLQLAELEQQQQAIPQSEAMSEWSQADNSNWYKVLAKNPVEITAGIMAQSLPAMAPAMALNLAAPGGRVTKAVATGVGSLGTEAANSYLDAARSSGYDFTDPEKVREFFDNPDAQTAAKEFAVRRGVPVGVFDALTAGLAGRFLEPALKQGAAKVLTATGKELAMQAAGGASGEAAAQITSGQTLSAKDIVAEALGELGSAPSEIVSNLREQRGMRNAERGPANPVRPPDDELPPTPSEPVPVVTADVPASTPPAAAPVPAPAESSAPVELPVQRQVREQIAAMEALAKLRAEDALANQPKGGEENGPQETQRTQEVLAPNTAGKEVPAVTPAPEATPGNGPAPGEQPRPDVQNVTVTDKHLRDAREILSADRPPDIVDELEHLGIGRVQFEPADYGDMVANTREQLSQTMFDKPWNKLRKNQREAVDKAHRLSTETGEPANTALKQLAENPKYADWSIDDLANALASATRAESKDFTAQERDLARQIAEAEQGGGETVYPPHVEDPLIPFEQYVPTAALDVLAQATYGKSYNELTTDQKRSVELERLNGGRAPFRGRQQRAESTGRIHDHPGNEERANAEAASAASPVQPAAAPAAGTRLTRTAISKLRPGDVVQLGEATRPGGNLLVVLGYDADPVTKNAGTLRLRQADDTGKTGEMVIQNDREKIMAYRPQGPDVVEAFLNRAIDATQFDPTKLMEGVTGAPVWLTKSALNGVLRVIRATYRGTKSLAQAMQAGIEWLRGQNLTGYNEAEAADWLTRNISAASWDDDLNFREFGDQLEAAQPLPPDPARMVANLLYERRTNETDAAFAARIIQAVGGPAAAMEVFGDATNGMPGAVRMFLGQLIIKQLSDAGQHEAAARFYDDRFAAHVTEVAQSLQSLNAFLSLSPEGKLIWAQRKILRAAQDMIAPVRPELEQARTELEQTNAAGIEATTAAPDVQQAARQAVDEGIAQQAATHGTEIQQAIRAEVLQQLVNAGLITKREMEITLLHLEAPGDTSLEAKLQSAGITDPKKRAQEILDSYKKRTGAERDKLKARTARARAEARGRLIQGEPNAVDAAIKKAMKELQLKLGKIIREHHTKIDATGKTLAEKIAAESGLSPEGAARLAEAVRRRFALQVIAAKRKILERLLRPVINRGLAKQDLAAKVIEATNLGALSAEEFWAALRKGLKLPEWTPELAGQIRKHVDSIEAIPDDQLERKQKAQTEMLNTIERAKGVDGLDLGLAFYLTNILTGFTTHAKNLLSTALNTGAALSIEGARAVAAGHPGDIALALTALGEGMKQGGHAAADVLRTGMVTGSRLTKLEPGRTLELTKFGHAGGVPIKNGLAKGVLENPVARVLNAWKYNYRLMAAEDLLFFKPAEEAKAALLAKRIARSEGMTGAAAQDRARVILGYSRAALDAAEAQASSEGLTGSNAKRRVAEILNANRPEQLRADAREFALRTTFNNAPYGFMGAVAGIVNQAKASQNRKLRTGANLIAPFTNIIANVVNESLNFTPVGFARSFPHGERLLGQSLENLSPDERADLKAELRAKALIGTALLTGLMLKAAGHLDDKDPEFAVYAGGPSADEDKRGWQAAGGLAHSLKIGNRYYSYANTPLALPLSWLGNIHDRMRDARIYGNRSAQRTAQSLPLMAVNGALGMPKVITEQSFLSGIADVAQMISEPNAEREGRTGLKMLTRTASSAAVPNLIRQVDKFFDPQVYEQRDAEGILVNAIPFVRGELGQPMLNTLGLPVTNPNAAQFTSPETTDPLVKLLAETGNWPSTPNRNQIYPRQGRTMTDAEFYQFVRSSGQLAREKLNSLTRSKDWQDYDAEAQAKIISRVFELTREQARAEMGF